MRGKGRAIGFAAGALLCAAISASLAGDADPANTGLGQLRDVVVTIAVVDKGRTIDRRAAARTLSERRVPTDFVPPDALSSVEQALGRRTGLALPPGSYVTASSLAASSEPGAGRRGAPRGTTPVEITVTGAGALAASPPPGQGKVDVVVSGEPGPGPGAGRTYIAARSVRLLGLTKAPAETGLPGDRFTATLALTRSEALALIRADGIARSIRLLAA